MAFEIINNKGIQIATFLFKWDRDRCFDLINEDEDMTKKDS